MKLNSKGIHESSSALDAFTERENMKAGVDDEPHFITILEIIGFLLAV